MKQIVALVLAVVLVGCSALQLNPGGEKYVASVCGEAAGQSACITTGQVAISGDGVQFAELVVNIAGPFLAKQFNYKGCAFTTYPETLKGAIVVTGSAVCKLGTVPVQAKVVVTLTPVTPAAVGS
jgi:hypothetical protein